MANDCLLKKIKVDFDNDNLPPVGGFVIKVNKKASISNNDMIAITFSISSMQEIKVKTTGNGCFATSVEDLVNNPLTEATITSGNNKKYYFKNDDYKIIVEKKYNISKISYGHGNGTIFDIPLEGIEYCTNLAQFIATNASLKDDISRFSKMTFLNQLAILNNIDMRGDISGISHITSMQHLNLRQTSVTGTVSELGKMTGLIDIDIDETGITGDIVDYVSSAVDCGRTTANPFYFYYVLKDLKFNGTKYDVYTRNCYIGWSSKTKITVYVGGNSYAQSTTIYALGATAEEIAAWEQAGKTVIQVP